MTDPYAALRLPAFRRFIAFLASQTLATMMQGVAVGWQLYLVTRDPLVLGLVGLAEAVPFIAFALPAGHIADKMDRRRLCLMAMVVVIASSGSLLGMTLLGLIRRDTAWLVYVAIFASGVARAFLQPTRNALSADIVPRELYLNSITWRSSTWQSSAVFGPALGGALVALGGPALTYGVTVALLVVSWVQLYRIGHHPVPPPPPGTAETHGLQAFLQGIHFVLSQPVLLGAQLLDLFSVLFAGAEALLPVFAADILHVGASGLGVLRAAPAAGSVLMSLYQSYRPLRGSRGRVMLVSVALYGLCISGFGLSRSFVLSVALLLLSGMFDNISVVLRSTLLQTLTPRHLFGRVSAVNAIFIGSSNEVGAFESGVAARLLGAVPAVVLGGLVPIGVVALVSWRVPALRKLDKIG